MSDGFDFFSVPEGGRTLSPIIPTQHSENQPKNRDFIELLKRNYIKIERFLKNKNSRYPFPKDTKVLVIPDYQNPFSDNLELFVSHTDKTSLPLHVKEVIYNFFKQQLDIKVDIFDTYYMKKIELDKKNLINLKDSIKPKKSGLHLSSF